METQIEKPVEKDIIDTLFKEKDNYQQTNLTQRGIINDVVSVYSGNTEDVEKTSKKAYFKPVDIPKMRTETSYIVPFIFSGKPEIEVEGVGEEDKTIALIFEKIINYRFNTIPHFSDKIEAWVKQATGVGTSILKLLWKFTTKKVVEGDTEYETPDLDEPDIEVPNILDCFYNPIIPDIENQTSIIFRSVLPVEMVKNNPLYDFTDENGLLNREKVESGSLKTNPYDSNKQIEGQGIQLSKAQTGLIEIYERVSADRIQTVADGKQKLVLRDKPKDTGFIEAIKLLHEPDIIPNKFEGYGVGQNTLGLSKGYHSIFNQTKYNVSLCNNPMFLFAKGSVPDKNQLVSKPGGGVEVDNQGEALNNVIQPLQFPDIKQGAIEILNKFDDEHKRASGANDLMQGAASNKTLGQDELATTYSSNRFELINRRFKEALADLAKMMLKMELLRIQSPNSPIFRIFPVELREQIYQILISEDAKNAKYNVRVKGDTTIAKNKDVQIKQLNDTYNLFGPILPPENQMEWARKILQLRGVDEIDKLVPDPQQYAQLQNQMLAQGNAQSVGEPVQMGGQPTAQGINQATYQQ